MGLKRDSGIGDIGVFFSRQVGKKEPARRDGCRHHPMVTAMMRTQGAHHSRREIRYIGFAIGDRDHAEPFFSL